MAPWCGRPPTFLIWKLCNLSLWPISVLEPGLTKVEKESHWVPPTKRLYVCGVCVPLGSLYSRSSWCCQMKIHFRLYKKTVPGPTPGTYFFSLQHIEVISKTAVIAIDSYCIASGNFNIKHTAMTVIKEVQRMILLHELYSKAACLSCLYQGLKSHHLFRSGRRVY